MRLHFSNFTFYLLCGLALLLAACEKEVTLVPNTLETRLVVEGTIENGAAPVVILTRSLAYFNSLQPQDLINAFVLDARVTVSNGSQTTTLTPVNVTVPGGQVSFYTTSPTLMQGQFNTTYQLRIEHQGQVYEATTRLGAPLRRIDSLWWAPAPNNPDTNRRVVMSRVTDPPGLGNYIRYFTRVNDSAFVPGLNSVFDDQFVDGTTYDIQIFKGQSRNVPFNQDEFGYFRRGDTVSVKLSNIDKATFDFWRTWEQNQANLGNPFGVPVKVLGNISNGALGYFGGYASQVSRIIIPN